MGKVSVLYKDKLAEYGYKSLSNIMPIENIPSVIKNGILSHERASEIKHCDIAMTTVQIRRERVKIPNGGKLHSYASTYFCPRNPMMYKKQEMVNDLCVLAVSLNVMDIDGCVVTDRNAATDFVRFYTPEEGLRAIDFDKVYARDWTDQNDGERINKKAIKCAEVLVPDYVPYSYVVGAYVANEIAIAKLCDIGFDKQVALNPDMFFSKGGD